jgi:two-component system, sensor histidine kinase and response regulator
MLSTTSAAILDVAPAIARLGGDAGIYAQLLELYEQDEANQIHQLEEAFVEQEAHAFERAAHSLKGLFASLGAEAARELAYQLEKAGRIEDWAKAAELKIQLPQQLEALHQAIHHWRTQQG